MLKRRAVFWAPESCEKAPRQEGEAEAKSWQDEQLVLSRNPGGYVQGGWDEGGGDLEDECGDAVADSVTPQMPGMGTWPFTWRK